ncbi:GlsB/YeaQ/YmgE family stress response membrane protein [Actinoplanes sp. HUAS TT8]|uniref:GlsB/YeaQ/YmgE family stress response membrane protein n=1 Tax=Actinoplanes sp. HUAS TT8 TaxID=3447453 RepID=UPI003F51F322
MEINGIFTGIVFGLIIGMLGRAVVPGKQNIALWATLLVGVVAGLAGTFLAVAFGVDDTDGIDWIELALQVGLAAIGVALVSGAGRRRRL